MPRYGVIIERAEGNLSAYVPDLPGCVTTGRTVEDIRRNMREALTLHLRGMLRDQDPIPEAREVLAVDQPDVWVTFVEVDLQSAASPKRAAK